jgi:hypothetical protein
MADRLFQGLEQLGGEHVIRLEADESSQLLDRSVAVIQGSVYPIDRDK